MRQNFPLMSNSRIDDFYIIPFLFLSSLSSLCCTYDYCICTIAVVLNFHISAPRRKNRGGGREKKEKRTPIDSSSRLKRGIAAARTKKGSSQKRGLRARVSSGAQLIEVHLCACPAARRSENAIRDNDGYRDISTVCTFNPLLPGVTRVDESRMTREEDGRRVGGRSGGRTLIKPS